MSRSTTTLVEAGTDTAELAGRLRLAVARLNRLLRQQGGSGLSPTKLAFLVTINKKGPLTLGELAAMEQVAPPTVTKVVKGLEDRGLLTRSPDPADRRVVRVAITAEGRARLRASRTRKNAWLAQRLASVDADQRQRLLAAMDVLEELTQPSDDAG